MSDSIYKLSGEDAAQIESSDFTSEDSLQRIIAKNPSLLLREEDTNDDNRLHLVQRELLLPGEYAGDSTLRLDHFLVDNNAVPFLVEVKLVSNPQCRREVVGQMLDYAARISYYDSAELRDLYMKNNNDEDSPVEDSYAFWKDVSANLRSGRVNMVFAANRIPNTLKSLIRYLGRCAPYIGVYGVEIAKHHLGDSEYLTTSFIQNESASYSVSLDSQSKHVWDDRSMNERLMKIHGDYAVDFFSKFKKEALSLGFSFKYGNASYINARFSMGWRWCHEC